VTALAAGRGLSEPGRSWALALLYPLAAAIVALFIAYPVVELLAHAAMSDGRVSFAPLARVLSEPYNRQAIYNTLLLGLTVAVLGTILAALYAYAMTRVEMPGKAVWHFLALLPTISPPILMALSLILLYGRRGLVTHELLGLQTTALYGYWGLVVAQVLSYFPFAYLLLLNLFRGLDASLPGIELSHPYETTNVTLDRLCEFDAGEVRDGISASSLADARETVDNLAAKMTAAGAGC